MDGLRRDAARNRDLILEAARDLARQPEPVSFNVIARTAGVGVGTVYRHFATVEELEETIVWERFDHLEQLLRSAGPADLDTVLGSHFALLVEDPVFERVAARPETAFEQTATQRDALIARLAQLMDLARADRQLGGDVDAAGVMLLMCGLAHAARSARLSATDPAAQALLTVVLSGLRAGAARPLP